MSIETTLARISELNSALSPAPPAQPPQTSSASFAGQLQGAMGAQPAAATASVAPPAGGGGGSMLQIAHGEVGQAEPPPGSNNSPRIAQYRSATAGNPGVGPWCAYFVSWAARQAGAPLGNQGQGFGSVDHLWSWAQSSGRAYQGTQQQPQPGDLIVFHEHVGMVESVLPDGRIQTIEGNSSDQVSRRIHAPGDAVGYVRVG